MSPQYIPPPDADTWEPPAGTVKLVCPVCKHPFASRGLRTCATCTARRHLRAATTDDASDQPGLIPARPGNAR